jgi:ketosteroid isomerase-like protein
LGKAAAVEIYAAIAASAPRLTYLAPKRISVGGETVVLEFDGHGSVDGHDCSNNMAVSFDIANGKVREYREYIGDIDPALLSFMSNCRRENKGLLDGTG